MRELELTKEITSEGTYAASVCADCPLPQQFRARESLDNGLRYFQDLKAYLRIGRQSDIRASKHLMTFPVTERFEDQ